jgi:NAD(P)-dependent dehydrogenase (short-subunit alcohol dehydrogenase family)
MREERKRVIITGATAGIGEATTRLMTERGWRVLMVARRAGPAETLTRETGAAFLQADIRDADAPSRAIAACVERFGGVDALVNNAALDYAKPLLDVPDDELRATIEADLVAPIRWLRDVGRHLAGAGGGVIVNVSSRLGVIGVPGLAVYGAAKGGVNALTRHAAVELAGRNVRVCAVAPGLTDTPLVSSWIADQDEPGLFRAALAQQIPQKRIATPRDVAAAVAFLTSDDAAHITGVVLAVDGGYTAQ